MSSAPLRHPAPDPEQLAANLLELIAGLTRETGLNRSRPPALDDRLAEDLGLDSLTRAELIARLERQLEVRLAEEAIRAATPRELLAMILAAEGGGSARTVERLRAPDASGGAVAAPEQAATLLDVLHWHARRHARRTHIYLYGEDDQPNRISYGELLAQARRVAAGLWAKGFEPGRSVAIMLPTGRGYFASFYGILLAGGTPVPIYPPVRLSQLEEHLRRHGRILANARAVMLITVPEALTVSRLLRAQAPELSQMVTVEDLESVGGGAYATPLINSGDAAFLQYTSGSTGDPKGVVLSHANLLANIRAMGRRVRADSNDVFVSWLPLYHDMGLIGAGLGSLYYGFPLVLLSPLAFLRRPLRWLETIHRHRGTLSAAPNFAYELCLRTLSDADLTGLDLSSWRLAANGAEPVNPATMERFAQRFERCGLDPKALAPVYGLAECSVGLALPTPGQGLQLDCIDRAHFESRGEARPADPLDSSPLRVPACGHALDGHEIRIVDDRGREQPERWEGRLEFRGPSATAGYLDNPKATAELRRGDWLDSGDRGYLVGGRVYLTGRVKDLIIRGGRNLYPYELEEAVGAISGIRRGCVAVFASPDPGGGPERLVVVAETRETQPLGRDALGERVREALGAMDVVPDVVELVPPHGVLKTSSGKIRRAAMAELYRHGGLGRGSRALWWQLARLTAGSALPQIRRWLRGLGESLYAGWAWGVFGVLILATWGLVAALPWLSWRWAVVRGAGRLLTRLTGVRLTVQGAETLTSATPCVIVANHASYLDALALSAALPGELCYVAKRELAGRFSVRLLLERLGALFVERFDPRRSADELRPIAERLRVGRSLVFFPEGTFHRMPGLLPFRMGAFLVAAQAKAPVVPVAIRGARSILREGTWFPRRGNLDVVIGQPMAPKGGDWSAAVALRDGARAFILRHSEEPDLVEG